MSNFLKFSVFRSVVQHYRTVLLSSGTERVFHRFNSVLTGPSWESIRPQGKGSVPHTAPTSRANPKSRLSPVLANDWLKPEPSPSPRVPGFAGMATEHRKTPFQLPVSYKGHGWTTARWRGAQRDVCEGPKHSSFCPGEVGTPPSRCVDTVPAQRLAKSHCSRVFTQLPPQPLHLPPSQSWWVRPGVPLLKRPSGDQLQPKSPH